MAIFCLQFMTKDQIIILLCNGFTDSQILESLKQQNVSPDKSKDLLEQAKRSIAIASDYDQSEQIGKAITRINEIFKLAQATKDIKTALQAQRELNKLLGLYKAERKQIDTGPDPTDLQAQLDEIAAHLLPLQLTDETYPLSEHARIAAHEVIKSRSSQT